MGTAVVVKICTNGDLIMQTAEGTVAAAIVELSNGQITIPAGLVTSWGIDSTPSVLIEAEGNRIVVSPLDEEDNTLREYTDEEIARFLQEDELDPEIAARVRGLSR